MIGSGLWCRNALSCWGVGVPRIFKMLPSTEPSFSSTALSDSVSYKLESASRLWAGPSDRTLRVVNQDSSASFYVQLGSSTVVAASSYSELVPYRYPTILDVGPSQTYVAFFSSTSVTVNVTMGTGGVTGYGYTNNSTVAGSTGVSTTFTFASNSLFGMDAQTEGFISPTSDNTPWWARLMESTSPFFHRDAVIGVATIQSTLDSATTSFNLTETFYTSTTATTVFIPAGMTFDVNVELPITLPIPANTPSVTCSTVIGLGDDSSVWDESTKIKNIRWKVSRYASRFPTTVPWSSFSIANEPDGNAMRFCAYSTSAGQAVSVFNNTSALNRTETMRRLTLIHKSAYDELRHTTAAVYSTAAHPSPIVMSPMTGDAMLPNSPWVFGYNHLLTYNNGEILNYVDVIGFHHHNRCSNWDTTSVNGLFRSIYWLWDALSSGQRVAGIAARQPVYCGEGTWVDGGFPNDQQSTWNTPNTSTNLTARELLKSWRLGAIVTSVFYWGVSAWSWYDTVGTTNFDFWGDAASTFEGLEPGWTACKAFSNVSTYQVTPGTLTISSADWTSFHDPRGWTILALLSTAEKANPESSATSTAAFYEWDRATIGNGTITFTSPVAGQGQQRNRACRNIILPGHGDYSAQCTFTGSTGGVRMVIRGYDLTNGLARTVAASTSSSGTLNALFTTAGHSITGWPNTPKCSIVLETTAGAVFSAVSYAKL